jgi:addiction module HigA family antidote
MLVSEFMEPLDLNAAQLAEAIGARSEHIEAVIAGAAPMDAELDLRLARYFRMSEGFFLGLQADYELRGEAGAERIARPHRPRAA